MNKLVVLLFALILSCFSGGALADFGGICGKRDGCGNSANDFRVFDPPPIYVPSPEEIANRRAVEINDQALNAHNRRDFREAIRLYELALQAGPNDANASIIRNSLGLASNNLGVELASKGDWEGALYWYQLAQQYYSDPVNADNIAKAQAAIEMIARQAELNKQGVDAHNRGDYREAIRLYESALQAGLIDADTSIIRNSLGLAYNNLGSEISHQSDWEEALRLYLFAQQYSSDPVIADNIAKAQAAIENIAREAEQRRTAEIAAEEAARKEAQRQTDLAAVQQRTSKLLANLRDDLARQASDANSTSTIAGLDLIAANGALAKAESDGLVFMDGTETQAKSTAAQESTDTSVVNARGTIGSLPTGLPRLEEVENSPGREAWLRGMDAVINHDWELAAAWFGTAQLRDPTNEAIGRAVALAQWTRNQHEQVGPRSTNSSVVAPTDSDLELLRADMDAMVKEMVDSMSPEELARLRSERQQDINAAKAAQRGAPVVMSRDDALAMVFPHLVAAAKQRPDLDLGAKAKEAIEFLNSLSREERARFSIDAAEKAAREILKSLSPEERKRLGLNAQEAKALDSDLLFMFPGSGGEEPDARTHIPTGLAPGAEMRVEGR